MSEAVGHGRALVLALAGIAARRAGASTRRRAAREADEGHAAAQVGDAGAVRRLLRGEGEGLLQEGRARREIKVGGPNIMPEQVVARRQAQFGVDWLPSLLAARDKGTDLVNIAQVFARRHDRAHLEGQRDQHDREDEGQEGRRTGSAATSSSSSPRSTKNGMDPTNNKGVTIVQQPFDMNSSSARRSTRRRR